MDHTWVQYVLGKVEGGGVKGELKGTGSASMRPIAHGRHRPTERLQTHLKKLLQCRTTASLDTCWQPQVLHR